MSCKISLKYYPTDSGIKMIVYSGYAQVAFWASTSNGIAPAYSYLRENLKQLSRVDLANTDPDFTVRFSLPEELCNVAAVHINRFVKNIDESGQISSKAVYDL